MTLGDAATKARSLTHSDTANYTAANLLIDINVWYAKVVSMIFESQDSTDFDDQRSSNYPIVTTPMVAAQRDYSIPVSEGVLKIKRVDVTYDGSNWYRATPWDSGVPMWGMGNETNVDANFIKQAPQYDVQYNSLFIAPLAVASDVSAGASIRVQWERNVTLFTTSDYTTDPTDSTAIPGFDVVFHPILAYGAAYEFANANNLPQLQNIKQDLMDWETRLRVAYGKKNIDEQLFLRPAYDNYGDYGAVGPGGYSYGR